MTTEFLLLLAVYAFLVIGVIMGDSGPIKTFENSTPKLAALVERNLATGQQFRLQHQGTRWGWITPPATNP